MSGMVPDAASIDDVDQATAVAQRLFDGVRRDQWDDPTPCSDWNVRQLMSHLVFGNRFSAEIFAGTRQGPPTDAERAADHLGDDPARAYREATQAMRDAIAAPGFLERTYALPVGQVPGPIALQIRLVEQLVHGWDLARATEQPADFPDDLAERALAASMQTMGAVGRAGRPFNDAQPVADDAPAIDRLAAYLGRSV